MGIFDGCLLASDIDGTLLINGYINPKNVEKIEHFIDEGGIFSLSTGRSVGAISDVLSQLKRVSPSVVLNGAIIYDYSNGTTLYDMVLPEKDHRIAKLVADSDINVGIEIHCGAKVFTFVRTKETTLHQEYEKFLAPDVTFDEVTKYNWNKAHYIFQNAEDREKVKALLKSEKTDCDFVETCACIDGVTYNYYEQSPKGVSKASSLKILCEMKNIKQGHLFAIGDYYNDIEMLEEADVCAVPIDSPEEIKSLADYITCVCNDGAVADFIDYLESKLNAEWHSNRKD